jgi:predicted CoA-binding protein
VLKNSLVMSKKTLVIGASENQNRYANKAVRLLKNKGFEVLALGKRTGIIDGVEIFKEQKDIKNLDTVTLYLNLDNQKEIVDYVLKLKPSRVIFNPGAENVVAEKQFNEVGIETINACTLVMLTTGQY